MFYTAAWCLTNENDFKKSIPFELLGKSLKYYNSTIRFNVVILEGIDLLSKSYLSILESNGFTILNYCEEFEGIINRYKSIDNFHSKYERNCFLRWIAFNEIRKSNNDTSQFWHLDSDVILHSSLNDIVEDTKGKTFVLQGCPVFVSISDDAWFEVYEKELKLLDSDIIGYSELARSKKESCKLNDSLLANESLYRYPLGHDQDLLEYLVSSKKIIQDKASVIYDSKYYFIQNPLSLKRWHSQQVESSFTFEEAIDFTITVGNKRVPFTHYQNTFSVYAEIYGLQKKVYLPGWLIKRILKFNITETTLNTTMAYKVLIKLKNWCGGMNRENTIKILMNKRPGQKPLLIDLLNLLLKS